MYHGQSDSGCSKLAKIENELAKMVHQRDMLTNDKLGGLCWNYFMPRCWHYNKSKNICFGKQGHEYSLYTPRPYPTNRNCFYNIRCRRGEVAYRIDEFEFARGSSVIINGELLEKNSVKLGEWKNSDIVQIQYTTGQKNYGKDGIEISWKCFEKKENIEIA